MREHEFVSDGHHHRHVIPDKDRSIQVENKGRSMQGIIFEIDVVETV